ncbi:carbohydrate-binding protein [Exilibacterium tricleocarpae]|uniref:Carbohydrate-binding protein n=1 Tax=Exilibacterium tricleocarpae TaxID=2591008 RepID=A0A545SLW5_9GAMM|nr:carbohydrate-binding protein [Exilibacterium tricleocarpae]
MNTDKKALCRLYVTVGVFAGLLFGSIKPVLADITNPVIGSLLFEENFDSLESGRWNIIEGNGCQFGPNLCGWGNQELQNYRGGNVAIAAVPGEPGNSALVLEARREAFDGSEFTSGKIDSENKLAVHYGMIEVRIRVPEVGIGLWPAAWMLGTSTASWPAKGEIDMMEMGHRAQSRAAAGFPGADINSYVGSNAIFYSSDACVEGNPSCAAMSAWQTDNAYLAGQPLSNRFVTYRTYWTDTALRFTVVDNGVEYDMYDAPIDITGAELSEFQAPFYLLLNLAVGGNFTDASAGNQVTAPLPAKMYVDYVRVYQINGLGRVFTGGTSQKESGTFGVFTDTTPTTNKLQAGTSSDIYIWNQNSVRAGTLAPAEGSEVIAWDYFAPNQWFGGGIQSRQPRDMSNFADGFLKFKIKIPADVAFKVGVTDTYTNENWLTFPAYQSTYGMVRNGEWTEVSIPVADLRGTLIALQSMAGLFNIASVDGALPTTAFAMAIDDVRWEGGGSTAADSDADGVVDAVDQCPGTPAGVTVDAQGCPLAAPQPVDVQVEAEDYQRFADTTPGNAGGAYRNDDVDIEVAFDGGASTGYNVGWTATGEWLEYDVELVGATYDVSARVASATGAGSYTLLLNDVVIGGSAVATGGWQSWETQSIGQAAVGTGTHTLKIRFDGPEVNIDWVKFTVTAGPAPDADGDGVPDAQDQCPGTPAGVSVDADGCAVMSGLHGMIQSGDTVTFYVNVPDWAIVHYTVNGGIQQNVTMTQADGVNTLVLTGLNTGDVLSFSFTYWDAGLGGAVDSDIENYTVGDTTNPVGDADNDGVPDDRDACPGTPAGTPVYSTGCPVVVEPVLSEVASVNGLLVGGVDSARPGFTLYVYDNDPGAGSNCNDGCAVNWPPLLVTDAGATGVAGLSVITRNDGARQAAFEGRPLYFYAGDNAVGDTNGQGLGGVWWSAAIGGDLGSIVPLFDAQTPLEDVIVFDRGDALVTRIADRARDRHAKENHFQAYDHYLTFYWEDRTAGIEIVDYVAKGGSSIRMNVVTQNKLSDTEAENRWWYMGEHTLAQYCGNGVMNRESLTRYWKEESWNCRANRPIQIGDKLEFEISQFLDGATLARGRANYYGTTYLYIVGEGLVPWDVTDKVVFTPGNRFQRDSIPVPAHARLGGDTTLHVQMTAEPDGHFQQMATNLGHDNGQPFVLGRRVHHTSFLDGSHDENAENGVFPGMAGLAGPRYVNERCASCHERNGRAPVAGLGEPLDRWVFKVGDANGNPHPDLGRVLQPGANAGAVSEGTPSIAFFSEENGLRKPNYQFTGVTPDTFSARIAPQLNGMGLLEAIPEEAILALADENDADGDGISGRVQKVIDPVTGDTRLGRFGYKAAASSVKHQIAAAFNTDMGVMTSVLPNPDCGANQTDCGSAGTELGDEHLDNLVKYVSLLGVRPQRDYNDPQVIQGKSIFRNIGCVGCHTETHQTSAFHPLAELRNQTIHPYTDLLLHDMGPGLADNLGEGEASGAEWRTAPLWGLGLAACVTGGVAGNRGWDAFGLDGREYCTPHHSYLHDGRARSIDEAIRWHGGEGEASKQAYEQLSAGDRAALLAFLNSL